MASDNQNFSEWSNKTKYFSGETSDYTFFKNKSQQSSVKTSPVVEGTFTPINQSDRTVRRPKHSENNNTQRDLSGVKSLTIPQGVTLNLPYTAGTVDYSFPNGDGYGFNDNIYDIVVQPDGKILVAGETYSSYYYNGDQYNMQGLIRLNSDGTVDNTFNITQNNDCYGGGFNDTVITIALQSDGKILAGGYFTYFDRDGNCYQYNRIIRINSDGSRDLTFNIGDGFNNNVEKIVVQPDGKILVGGSFNDYNGNSVDNLIRLNSNGSIDSSFDISNRLDGTVYDIVLQPDSKILVGGSFTNFGGNSQNYIIRLNSNGTKDTSFNIGNGFNNDVYTIALQSNGKIIVGGNFSNFDNNNLFNGYIVRLDPNGSLDTYFGYGLDNTVNKITIQSDDKILVGGYMGTFYIDNYNSISIDEIIRFHSDCTFDYSFYYNELMDNGVFAINVLSDGNILVGGEFNTNGDPLTYPLNYFGKLNNAILDYPYTYVVEDCNEPINGSPIYYTVGSMTELNTNSTYSFRKLSNPSVTVCGTINLDLYPSMNIDYEMVKEYDNCGDSLLDNSNIAYVTDMLDMGEGYNLLVDPKYVAGDILYVDLVFDFIGGLAFIKTVVQINQIVPTDNNNYFSSAIIPYQPYESVTQAVEVNGIHYSVVDNCETSSNYHYPLIHKEFYNNTSILLPSFGTIPCKEIDNVLTFAPYYLISAGTEEMYSVVEYSNCDECLTKNGSSGVLDQSFYDGGFYGGSNGPLVYSIVEQPDGKFLVGGNFEEYDGTTVNNFMRLNSDGTLDDTFFVGGFNTSGYVRAIALQEDGKILVGGNFTNYDGYNVGRIIRLNSDGTVDENFTFSTEFDNIVRAIAIQEDGKILVGGQFNYYYDVYCGHIIRLNPDGTPDQTFVTGDGFDGDYGVFHITVKSTKVYPQYRTGDEATTYFEDIIVGGWFDQYNGIDSRGIARLDRDGNLVDGFGVGFNYGEGGSPRVNQIFKQEDGKLIILGGADSGGELIDYQGTHIPRNIVRLELNLSGDYVIDETFDVPPYYYGEGGFNNGYPYSVIQQPNGKLLIGGNFGDYQDNNDEYTNLNNIVRLNTDGSYDPTFSMGEGFSSQVNKLLLQSDGKILAGGRFTLPTNYLSRLYIGEDNVLHNFTDCNGNDGYVYIPSNYSGSTGSGDFNIIPITYELIPTDGLNLAVDCSSDPGDCDDLDFPVVLTTPFDINFLGTNYTTVNVSTNPYITFGDGGDPNICCFIIPDEIPVDGQGPMLPGVFVSFECQSPPSDPGDYDSDLIQLYTGLTDNGNTLIIKYFGRDHCNDVIPISYTYKFYKDNSEYFDLLIDENTLFFNGDPTGGVSNGVDPTWVATFDSSSGNAYRIGYVSGESVKSNINETPKVCGTIGSVATTIVKQGGQGGSMYFDGTNNTTVTVDYNVSMDLDFNSWTVEWFQYYTSNDTCCRRVFDIGSFNTEHLGVSLENGSIVVWMEMPSGSQFSYTLLDPIVNTWSHFAISAEDIGGNTRIIRVFQNGVQLGSNQNITFDMNNFDGPTLLPLTIGGMGDGTATFQGYITNFRWNKGTCYYNSNTFQVPTSPLPVDGSQLLLLATDAGNYVVDSSGNQTINENNVTWSELNPFGSIVTFSTVNADATLYTGCTDCLSTVYYDTTLYVRNGLSIKNNEILPNFVTHRQMTLSDIQKVQEFGPIFTTRGPESYEIINYNL